MLVSASKQGGTKLDGGDVLKRLLLLSLIFFFGCDPNNKTNSKESRATKVRLALTNVPLPYLPVIVAKHVHFFEKSGLDVKIEDFSSASQVMQTALAGSAHVAAGTFEQDVQLTAQGRHVKAIALFVKQASRVLVALPGRWQGITRYTGT